MNKNMLFTVITCTFNRRKELTKLYQSLKKQKKFNFNWLIVDDWSSDGTKQFIEKLATQTNEFKIIYKRPVMHGGKYKAMNYAFPLIKTELFIFIDSDDWLVENGSLLIEKAWAKYKNLNIASIIMEHGKTGKNDPMLKVANNGLVAPRYYYMVRNHIVGDYADIFVTSKLKKFRFPEFIDEDFMTEGPMYYWMSKNYNSVFLDVVLTVGNYKSSGLSRNLRKLQLKNWHGTLFETSLYLSSDTPLWFRIKKAILYDYILIKKHTYGELKSLKLKQKSLLLLCYFPALLYSLKN